MFRKTPSLKKLRAQAHELVSNFAKNSSSFSLEEKERIKKLIGELDQKFVEQDRTSAHTIVLTLDKLITPNLPRKAPLWKGLEWVFALGVALLIATIVRMTVFELYEIPSGSMRPTFREGDHLAVSKTTFGINIPFTPSHLVFDPSRVIRGGVVTFTGAGVNLPDTDTRYFWLFPGKKRYIKRMIGKPSDTVSFYGGLIYGVDGNGKPIPELLQPPFLTVDHVPFNSFEQNPVRVGAIAKGGEGEMVYKYFNIPLGKLVVSRSGVRGEVFDGKQWILEQPNAAKEPHEGIKCLSDWFGMGGFGQTRITRSNALEISHHPYLAPFEQGINSPYLLGPLPTHRSFLPLDDEMIATLKSNLYTARFTVVNGLAHRLGQDDTTISLPGIPNGTYEFYNGEPQEILFAGVPRSVDQNHPLRNLSLSQFKTLFNLGIEFHPYYDEGHVFPSRYAYYRNGALYVMGKLLLEAEDSRLAEFLKKEKEKGGIPFVDPGVPSKEHILATGLHIKEGQYLVLGDNYAMSSDGRTFGTIPAGNLEGSPSFIFWPPGERFGATEAPQYPWWNPYTIIMWALFLGGVLLFFYYEKKKNRLQLLELVP
jgi:signal peptidase I